MELSIDLLIGIREMVQSNSEVNLLVLYFYVPHPISQLYLGWWDVSLAPGEGGCGSAVTFSLSSQLMGRLMSD